jgi:hypothetical protein
MNLMLIVPRVIKGYISQFPEVTQNAYPYFNYDHRVVEERVERGDFKAPYKGASDFTDQDYDGLVKYAQTIINPILAKYSARIANEDALHTAVRSYSNGLFDGKVNASHFEVLVKAMVTETEKTAGKKKSEPKPEEKPQFVKPHILKQLGLKPGDVPRKQQMRQRVQKGVPHLIKTDKGTVVKK